MVHVTPTIQSSLKLQQGMSLHSMFWCWPRANRSFPRYTSGKTLKFKKMHLRLNSLNFLIIQLT